MSAKQSIPTRRTDQAEPGLRKPIAGDVPLSQIVTPMVQEGELYHKLSDDAVRCYSCGHNCLIKPGGRGICQVRYNLGGKLYVPWGYVAALQCDPTEKKPFNHIYPGSDTLTFGMLGCDLHCPYCFTGDTVVVTDRGPVELGKLFDASARFEHRADGDIGYYDDLQAVTASGSMRRVRAVFKHHYRGQLVVIQPYYLPELRCTPEHRVYATETVSDAPSLIQAGTLTEKHYLAIPRHHKFSSPQIVDVFNTLSHHQTTYRIPWKLSIEERQRIVSDTALGLTSRQIGARLSKHPSYIRHIRSKLNREKAADQRTSGPLLEQGRVRFPKEHRPGIPANIPFNVGVARLLGYYCAEGCVTRTKDRPNSFTLQFAFGKNEQAIALETQSLLKEQLGIESGLINRKTTLCITTSKTSAALLLRFLAGGHSSEKHVPQQLFDAERPIVEAFINAFIDGDGHRYDSGKVTFTTVSRDLAYGVAWLALKLGYLPSLYANAVGDRSIIDGRQVKREPPQFTVVWYQDSAVQRKLIETEDFYLIPLRGLSTADYDGDVFNMEVEDEHNYLAGFFAVSNCQNWDISQALRDSDAGRPPTEVTPDELVTLALRNGAKCVASSYNEPLITSEWARAIFIKAKAAGLTCMYISNGNATREVLEYIRPYTDGYKIDLKSMREANYRKLGAVLETVLDGIQMVHQMGFWLEVVTLVIPGFNDSDDELRDAAQFIRALSPDIPWHVTAFHKDYRMVDPDNTDSRTLIRAAEIGLAEGLHYVYAGNAPGRVGPHEHTYCPNCHKALIKRFGYVVLDYQITGAGACPECGTKIAGLWPKSPKDVRLGTESDLYFRVPRPVR